MAFPLSKTRLHLELGKKKMIQAAGSGSYSDQMALVQYIETNGNCDASISQAVVQCLDPRLIPTNSSLDHHCVVSATGALCIISTQCRVIILKGANRKPMIELLKKHYLDFVKWFRFLMGKGNFTLTSAAFLFMMTNMDEDLTEIVMGSRSVVDTAMLLWRSQDSSGRYFIPDEEDDLRCPMLLLLKKVVQDRAGRCTLLSILQGRPARATWISRTIKNRIQQLGSRHTEGCISGTYALKLILDLVQFMRVLLYRATGMHPYFLESLQSPEAFFNIFYSLSTIFRGESAPTSWAGAVEIFHFAFELLPDIGLGSSSPVAKIKSALDGGLLHASILLLLRIPTTRPEFSFILDCISSTVGYATYRGVSLSLSKAVVELDQDLVEQASKKAPGFATCRAAIEMTRRIWDLGLGQGVSKELCHCIEHLAVQGGFQRPTGTAQKCSGCHAVTYCSSQCQRADWRSRHREECAYIRRKIADPGVSHYSRIPFRLQAELAYFTEATVEAYLGVFERIHARENIGPPLHSLVLNIDNLSLPPAVRIESVAAYKERKPMSQRRINDFLVQHLKDPDAYLVDCIFSWGLLAVNMLVTLRRLDRRFRATGATIIAFVQPTTRVQTLATVILEAL